MATKLSAALLAVTFLFATVAVGQEIPQTPSENPPPEDFRRTFPTVTLTYYGGREGHGWKERCCFDLDKWSPHKDVLISAAWVSSPDNSVAPGASSPGNRRSSNSSFQRRATSHRVWKVEYVDALADGESNLFVGGAGLRRKGMRIYGDDDCISLLHIPTSGWHELGQAARLYRYSKVPPPPAVPTQSN